MANKSDEEKWQTQRLFLLVFNLPGTPGELSNVQVNTITDRS